MAPTERFTKSIDGNDASYYELVRWLGGGEFSETKLFNAQRQIVIKKISNNGYENAAVLRRAEDEAELLVTLSHPNIVRIYNVWSDLEENKIVMELEFCGGGSLKKLIEGVKGKGGQFIEKVMKSWLAQLAFGIAYLHDFNIVRRNLKSDNVFLSTDKTTIKIGDIESTRLSSSAQANEYMAPEMFGSSDALKSQPKVDIWSLGVIAYEMATLELPYPDIMSNQIDLSVKPDKIASVERLSGLRNLIENKLLIVNQQQRADIGQVLTDPFISSEINLLNQNSHNYIQEVLATLRRENGSKDDEIKRLNLIITNQAKQSQDEKTAIIAAGVLQAKEADQKIKELEHNAAQFSLRISQLEADLKRSQEEARTNAAQAKESDQKAQELEQRGAKLSARIGQLENQLKERTKEAALTLLDKATEFERKIRDKEDNEAQLLAKIAQLETKLQVKCRHVQPSPPPYNEKDANDLFVKSMFEACHQGDIYQAQSLLLSQQIDVNALYDEKKHGRIAGSTGWSGFNSLMFAVQKGNSDIVRMLLIQPNVAQRDKDGMTALHYAAWNGDLSCVRLLVEHGKASLEAKDKDGCTPLMVAAKQGRYQVANYLLQHGANVNERCHDGRTALGLTRLESVKQLLKTHFAAE